MSSAISACAAALAGLGYLAVSQSVGAFTACVTDLKAALASAVEPSM